MAISRHDKQALADLFIHMGVPLVVAMQTVESWSEGEEIDTKKRAENLSKLLTLSVEFATKLTKKLGIRDAYTLENVRGKIIRIVTPIIAQNYLNRGVIPTEESLSDLVELFDVLISFAESVSPTDEKGSKPVKVAAMIEACDPLLTAIRQNDLAMGKEAVFHESVNGIMGRADQMASALNLDGAVESGLFKSILSIYVSCYIKIAEEGSDIATVWRECDESLALIYGLTSFVGEQTGTALKKQEPAKASEPKPQAKDDNKKAEEKPDTKDNEQTHNDDDEDDGGNPMSFFAAGG
jgi:hypothetical protein